ncbi:MAG: pilus assembly protein PilM [Candidatus Omnitrophica bacterium]|nr:pilus assembly protein PilM [Candidatus Omnitrophota bacterium]
MDKPKKAPAVKNIFAPLAQGFSKLAPILGPFFSALTNIFASTQNIIGLDIGSSYIKIVQLQKERRGYVITNCVTRAIPLGIRDNPAQKKILIREFVKEFIAGTRIKTNLGRIAVKGKGVLIFSFTVPALSKKDLRGAVSIELKKRLPFQMDLSNISFDYFITNQAVEEKELKLQITCICVDNIMLDEHTQLLKDMGLRPVTINVSADSLGNLIQICVTPKPNEIIAVLEMGANTSTINFYKGYMLQFSREIAIGGEHLTRAMTKTVTTSRGAVDIIAEEAEKLKRECGIPLDDKTEFLTDFGLLTGAQITAMIRPLLEHMVREVSRTFNYYCKTFNIPKVERLFITGGSSRLKNIEAFLASNLEEGVAVERLDPLKAIKGWADTSIFRQELVMEQAAPHLSVAFGLCLGKGGSINLLPQKEKLEQKAAFMIFIIRFLFPILLGLNLMFYVFIYMDSWRYQALIIKAQSQIDALRPTADKIREYLSMKKRIDDRRGVLERAVGRQPLWWGMLKELSRVTPEEAVLYQLRTTEKKMPLEVSLKGEIYSTYTTVDLALSQYLLALAESPYFNHVQLISSETDIYSPIPKARFEIVCELAY